jgi:peptidyl-prolyl cis-trans isomerase SurA
LFGSNRFEADFIKGLYGLKKGEISKPVRTSFGWHIVRIDDIEPVVINDELRSVVKNRILQDSRSNKGKEAFVERMKKENNFKEFIDKKVKTTPIEDFYTVVNNSIFEGNWNVSQANALNKNMFSFAEKNYNQQDFAKYLGSIQSQFQNAKDVDIKVLINYTYRQFIENTVIDYEDALLEQKYPEFAQLMKEYREGILIYELSEVKVWRKAVTDSVGLEAFYQTVKENHLYPVRAQAEHYKAVDAASMKKLVPMLQKGISADKIMEKMNKKSITLVLDTVIYWQGQNKQFDKIVDWNQIGNNKIFYNTENEGVRIMKVLQPSPKPLDEARGTVVAEYQIFLEKEWLENIRKSPIWIDYNAILSLIK